MNDCAGGDEPPALAVKFRPFCDNCMELDILLTASVTVTVAWPLAPSPVIVMWPVYKPAFRLAGFTVNPRSPGATYVAEPRRADAQPGGLIGCRAELY